MPVGASREEGYRRLTQWSRGQKHCRRSEAYTRDGIITFEEYNVFDQSRVRKIKRKRGLLVS